MDLTRGNGQNGKGLSMAAATALIDAGTSRQGARISYATPGLAQAELRAAGLIGVTNGLTRKGSAVREQLMDEKLREAFGA